jgi:hypothetical protein
MEGGLHEGTKTHSSWKVVVFFSAVSLVYALVGAAILSRGVSAAPPVEVHRYTIEALLPCLDATGMGNKKWNGCEMISQKDGYVSFRAGYNNEETQLQGPWLLKITREK